MFKRALILAMIAMTAAGVLLPALGSTSAQGAVTVTPNREYVNVRLWPAIGATVIGSLGPGDVMTATGVSVDGAWARIDFFGGEGWVALLVVDVTGDLAALPLADPRTIPYNSNTVPGAGGADLTSPLTARLEDSGLSLRAGPSTAYPVLANIPRYAEVDVTGRTASGEWAQVSWGGLVGWVAMRYLVMTSSDGTTFIDMPIVPAESDTGVLLSDDSARDRFLIVDDLRRQLEAAGATLTLIDTAWGLASIDSWPETCSAPPLHEEFWLNAFARNEYPDLVEAVARYNQGINDLNNAITGWLDACNAGATSETVAAWQIEEGQAAVARAYDAFEETLFRVTGSKIVLIQAIQGHINYAQDQFERIEAIWLDVRFGVVGDPPCVNLPQQPPDYALTAWEQDQYPELIPLVDATNEGLAVLREAIRLWANECAAFSADPNYVMPGEVGAAGYNTMLEARTLLNLARDTYLIEAYAGEDVLVPAPTATPNATIDAILHAPYTPTFTLTPTPGFAYSVVAVRTGSAYHVGCSWFGVAGEVLTAAGEPRPAALVHVYGPGFNRYRPSGSAPRYGDAGFEISIPPEAAPYNTYTVRIEDGDGNPLSPDVPVTFDGDCRANVVLVTFTRLE